MDIVLEAFDRYLFDYVYATLLPTPPPGIHALKDVARNGSFAEQSGTQSVYSYNGYQYRPASQYISWEPTQLAYMSRWSRDSVWRQALSLYLITWLFGAIVYFTFATLSYVFVFDKATFNHPKYLKNQVRQEIRQTLTSLPIMAIFTVPFFVAEIRGHSKMYDATADGPGLWYNYAQFGLFLCFTDFCIYWIHRGLHHPLVYKRLHKPHHRWIMPTPFASHAFHPLDGYAQSVPYHVFPFLFPLQKFAYVALFVFINIWTVLIHDGEYVSSSPIINGAACHTTHHLYFNYNYGQYTTIWDRLGGSYRQPSKELFKKETKMAKDEWERQSKEMEKVVKEVEGVDDRTYGEYGGAGDDKKSR